MAMSFIQKHPKSGVYRVRLMVPKELRGILGKSELLRSLGTKDYTEAKRLAPSVLAEFQLAIDRAEKGEVFWHSHDIELVVHEFFAKHAPASIGANFIFEDEEQCRREALAFCIRHKITGERDQEEFIGEILSHQDACPPKNLVTSGHKEKPRAASEAVQRSPETQSAYSLPVVRISEFEAVYMKTKRIADHSLAEVKRAFNFLVRLKGDVYLHTVSLSDMRELRDILLAYPVGKGSGPSADKMDLREVPNHKWDRTITPKTVRKYLNHLGLAFKLAVSEGYLEKNPRDGLIIADATETSVETERLDFRASHLRKIFGAPLFNTCHNDKAVWKPGGVKVRDHRYWIPILGLFTGARLSEITQLTAENVRQDHGIWYLEITNNDENGKKKVKTKQSKREVPLHQTIIDLGFIDFVKKRKKGLLFDHYGDAKRMSHEFSKWFGRFMDKLGLTDPGLTFHSYRHTWKTAARFANIPDGAADAMTGHAAQNVGDTYGRNKRRIEYLKEQVDRIHFAGLSLEG